jgi:anti-anti-sigma regulatory factor/PAS domain-containing protein
LQNLTSLVRAMVTDSAGAYAAGVVANLNLGALSMVFLLFFSALFVPQWWQGSRPIRWICIPHALVLVVLCIDLIGRAGLITNGQTLVDGEYRWNLVQPGAWIVLVLFTVSWGLLLVILAFAFVRERRTRPLIGLLFLAIAISSTIGLFGSRLGLPERVDGLFQTALFLAALAYAVLRTRLFTPTRAALDLALQALREAVAVLDRDGEVVYANPQAAALGFGVGQPAAPALHGAGAEPSVVADLVAQAEQGTQRTLSPMALGARQIEFSVAPVADTRGRLQGTLLLGRDVTEVLERSAQLERERQRLAATVRELEDEQAERAQLAATVQELSLPLIPVLEGVLVLPLIGAFDSARIAEFTSVLLEGVERERARLVLIDITGMPLLDTHGAAGLLRGVRAAALIGARCVLVGVRPEIAQSLVSLGVPLAELATAATLQQAVRDQLRAEERRAPISRDGRLTP